MKRENIVIPAPKVRRAPVPPVKRMTPVKHRKPKHVKADE